MERIHESKLSMPVGSILTRRSFLIVIGGGTAEVLFAACRGNVKPNKPIELAPAAPSATATKVLTSNSTPSPTPTETAIPPPPTPTAQKPEIQPTQETLPAKILDLINWKLTLPTGTERQPTEITQPRLANYQNDPWFRVTEDGLGVLCRAAVDGVTTRGSQYPRSEFREMTNNGRTNASWSSASGIHTMLIDQAITAIPKTKGEVVAGQIHDEKDDIIVVRLEFSKLYINVAGKNVHLLDPNYALGKRFKIKFEVSGDQTRVYYNDGPDPVYILDKNYSGAYFKAGAYTQSNCSREGSPSLCNDNNYGEVVLYQLAVTHR